MVLSTDQVNQTKKADQAKETDNAAVMRELQKIADLKKMQQNMDTKTYENILSDAKRTETLKGEKAYQAKLQKDQGIRVLSSLAKDLASLGIDLTPKMDKKSLNSKINDELEQLSQSMLKGDKLDLTKDAVRRMQNRQERQQEERQGEQGRQGDIRTLIKASDVKEAVQKYSAAYAEETLLSAPEAKDKLINAREILKQKGFSEKDIELLGKSVDRSLKTDFLAKMQDDFIQQVFTPKNAFQFIAKPDTLGENPKMIVAAPEIRKKLVETKAEKLLDETTKAGRPEKKGGKHHEVEGQSGVSGMNDAHETREAVHQYSSVFAQFAAAASPEARAKLEEAKDNLRKKGASDKDILSIEKTVKRSLKSGYTADIQDSFIDHMFSPKNSFQYIVTAKHLNNAYEEAVKAKQLTGISSDAQSVKEQMANIAKVSHQEIKDFVKDAVESRLIERHLSGKDNRAEVKKLVELGYKVGFNFNAFVKTWEQKKFDLGLFVLEVQNAAAPQEPGKISIGEISAGGVSEKHGYEMTKDEERELLINQLRAEMMKRAITGDPFAVFSFSPKIRKLKNGLIKLGLETEDFMKIEKEAKALARYRTLEMLKESFIERATYYELSGPAYGLLKNKIKGLVSNLGNLDMSVSKEELDYLRDEANRMMHDHAIIELKSAASILENQENPAIEKKVPMMVKLIQRLKDESGFSHGVGEDIDEVVFRHQHGQKAVKENA
jgi:hypothetical protein